MGFEGGVDLGIDGCMLWNELNEDTATSGDCGESRRDPVYVSVRLKAYGGQEAKYLPSQKVPVGLSVV